MGPMGLPLVEVFSTRIRGDASTYVPFHQYMMFVLVLLEFQTGFRMTIAFESNRSLAEYTQRPNRKSYRSDPDPSFGCK
jgi:hypothetical protein